jgi:hypothetical protein
MTRNPFKALLLGATFAVFAAACSDSPTPPDMVQPEASFSHNDHIEEGFTDVSALVTTIPADATVWTKRVTFANNLTGCEVFGIESDFGGKIDTGNPGTYTLPGSDIEVTLESLGGNTYAVSVESGYVFTDVFLKSDVENNDWYHFVPGVSSASGMTTGDAALSHFTICVNEVAEPLTAEKTAVGTYDREVTWELEKSVDPDAHTGGPGDEFDSDWTVLATKSEALGNYLVEGTITIHNPNNFAVPVTVSDELDDGTVATVECAVSGDATGTVPANGSLLCSYSASPADDSAEENEAVITSGDPNVQGATATAGIDWFENLIGDDEVQLEDERFEYSEAISATTEEVFPEAFICPADLTLYVDGTYEFTEENEATLTGDNTDLSADASVVVTCSVPALEVEKTAEGSYDRTVEWELEKSVDPDAHSGAPGDEFDSDWEVVATKSEALGNYKVEGTISIYNPAGVAQDFSVSDVLDDGTSATVVCPGTGDHTGTVPAGETVVCDYTAYPLDGSAEENIATVSAAGNPDVEAKAPVSFTENLIGFDEGTLSDPRFGFAELISASRTEVFPETFMCPEDLSLYVDGLYSFDEVNTAYLNGNLNLEASATVTVTCEAICPFAILAAEQGLIYTGDCRETAWAANGSEPGSLRYTTRGNWATYVDFQGFEGTGKTVNFYAAETLLVGTVSFSAVAGDMVTITIDLDPGFSYEDGYVIAVQDYASAPSGNPSPGLFDHKFEPGEPIIVPANNFYGVHAVIAGN